MTDSQSDQQGPALENLLSETRQFDPPAELAANANVKADAYDEAAKDRLAFWAKQAGRLDWAEQWTEVLDWSKPPFAKWFVGGKLNAAYNCVDRHVEAGNGDKVAIHWEGEPGDTRTITYADLKSMVCKAANALTDRIIDCDARIVITADGQNRRGAPAALKPAVDEAVDGTSVRNVLVVK